MLTSGNKELAREHIQRGIFWIDALPPLLLVLGLIPLISSHIRRKVNAGYQSGKNPQKKLNHFLLMDNLKLYGNNEKEAESIASTVRIFSNNIAMKFGINKCAHITIKVGNRVSFDGMELSSGEVIPELASYKGYKYLGILEANDIVSTVKKVKIWKEYYRRVRQVRSLKLNCGKAIRPIYSRAVSLVRFNAGILKWKKMNYML